MAVLILLLSVFQPNYFYSYGRKQNNHFSFSRYAFLSDYLTDLCTGKSKKNFVKNCPQLGLNLGPPDYHSNVLPTELGRNLLGISEVTFVCFMHHFTYWTLFILESIEHDLIKALMIHTDNQIVT